MNVILNFVASEFVGENEKVRIRKTDNKLEFRPTNRKNGVNLPEGERLLPIVRMAKIVQFSIKDELLIPNDKMIVCKNKHGWYIMLHDIPENNKIPSAKIVVA